MSGNIHKRPKGAARILTAVVASVLALSLAGCATFDSWVGDIKGELTGNAFTVNYRDDKRRGLDVGVAPATLL